MTATFNCRDCGHAYGTAAPHEATIALHRHVSHTGKAPITNAPALPTGYVHTGFEAGML